MESRRAGPARGSFALARPVKVLLVATHPVQYAAPLYRRYAEDPRLDMTVAYCSLQGAETYSDRDFCVDLSWDIPLLEGYRWVHPPNRSPRPRVTGLTGLINPGLWSLICSGEFDVVVCYGYRMASAWIAFVAARRSGSALVFTTDAHSWEVQEGPKTWKSALKRVIVPRIFSFVDAVFAPSSASVEHIRQMGLDEGRIFMTPNVVANEFFARAQTPSSIELRRSWGVPEGARVALYVAKLVPWKRPLDLLNAAIDVDGLHVVIVGSGVLRPELEAVAAQKRLSGRVHLLGFVNQQQLPEIYAASDFLVLPSEYEPFGLVVNEAFAAGRPAVVSDACGAAGDLVAGRETGFVYPAGDLDSLQQCLRALTDDLSLATEMGKTARRRIEEWSPQANAEAFAHACLTLKSRNRRRPVMAIGARREADI